MSAIVIRNEERKDAAAVARLVERAFGGNEEVRLVERLHADGDVVLALVAKHEGHICGHVLFSRLSVSSGMARFPAVALAPLAVDPDFQRRGIGTALVEEGHRRLEEAGERLSIVLGDPAYYGRFGYRHDRAADFESVFQCDALQALAWGEAPTSGRLAYASAFAAL